MKRLDIFNLELLTLLGHRVKHKRLFLCNMRSNSV